MGSHGFNMAQIPPVLGFCSPGWTVGTDVEGQNWILPRWVSQGRECGLWDGWRSFRPLLFSLNSWEFPRCLEFEVILQQRRMGQQVSAYNAAEMKTSWKNFTLWCSSGNSVELKHTLYISHSSTYLAWRETLNLFIFLYFSSLKCVLGCTFP